ncbi:hypothetical protein [Streptomyces sp. WZ-12]|uniref:hypothetical protein n=1 Tax=Streptomyces sp. WZ-12 TaxID=3030210 RepID=UPI0023818F0E|nr:hypothetical protein [Streptomyces sp. WZ-12]
MAYDPQIAVIHSVRARLTALAGIPPRVIDEGASVRIETDVTDALLRRWTHAVPVFSLGSEFGLITTTAGQIAWLRIELREGTP